MSTSSDLPQVHVDYARECVERGAKLLDERVPGWFEKIDLDKLDISSGRNCALGQVFAEPQRLPTWRAYEYASAEAYIKDSLSWYDADELTETIVNETTRSAHELRCVANYNLGTKVLGLGIDEAAYYGFNEYTTVEKAMVEDGLSTDQLMNDPTFRIETLAHYWDLDVAWEEAISHRYAELAQK